MSKTPQGKATHELSRKEMKAPDRFQVAVSQGTEWLGRRRKAVAVGAAVVVGALVLAVAGSSWKESRQAKAGALLAQAVDAAAGQISPVPLPNSEHPVYRSAEERAHAVIEAAGKVREAYGGTVAAATAALLQGGAYMDLGEWDRAIAAYQAFLSGAPGDDSLRFAALDGLARAQERKGNLEAAMSTYATASEIPSFRDRALLERARLLGAAGKKDEAKKVLESIPPTSPLRGEAQERLARLGE